MDPWLSLTKDGEWLNNCGENLTRFLSRKLSIWGGRSNRVIASTGRWTSWRSLRQQAPPADTAGISSDKCGSFLEGARPKDSRKIHRTQMDHGNWKSPQTPRKRIYSRYKPYLRLGLPDQYGFDKKEPDTLFRSRNTMLNHLVWAIWWSIELHGGPL